MSYIANTFVIARYNPNAEEGVPEKLQDWLGIESDPDATWGMGNGSYADWVNDHQHKWFKHLPTERRRTAIQAGGCWGLYPRMLAEKFTRVYTFEPTPLSFHCLVNNCQVDNVYKIQAALGDAAQQINMHIGQGHYGGNHVGGGGDIPMMPLDAFNFQEVDLIALDVENYEINALRGARRTIDQWKPVIVIECATDAKHDYLYKELRYDKAESSAIDMIYIPR